MAERSQSPACRLLAKPNSNSATAVASFPISPSADSKTMKLRLPILAALCVAAGSQCASAASILRITEVMSNGDTVDWFELTNYGDTAASLANFRMDDSSFAIGSSVAMADIPSIAPGQSVIFLEGDSTAAATFRTNWNLSAAVLVGTYSGSGAGLSAGGDGVTVFTNTSGNGGVELSGVRVSFGSSTPGTSFAYTYDATGAPLTGPLLTTAGTTWSNGGTNMLGTPGAIPEPSSMLLGGIGALALLRRRRA